MPQPLPLEVREVFKAFGSRQALAGASLAISPAEILGLLGPNGAGKSTLVKSVVGRVRPDSGEVRILGNAPSSTASRSSVGYVPQEIALYPTLSPRENLAAFGRYQGLSGETLKSAIGQNLEWAGLSERAGERTDRLSGGMRRRLNIAAGTIHRPRLLLLDEPTVGVDPQSRERIYSMIEELKADGVSLLYTTHYMEEAERLCDRIAIIDNGRIIALGTKDELVRRTLGTRQMLAIEAEKPVPEELRRRLETRGAAVAENRVQLSIAEPAREIAEVLEEFRRDGVAVRDMTLKTATLEAVFLQLTGKELRE
jgi:ABC-type multidrug transport system, ATPase component